MSTTFHLECDTCKESIWIGQSGYIYTGEPKAMKALGEFLYKHTGLDKHGVDENHALFFRSSHLSKYMDGMDSWTE